MARLRKKLPEAEVAARQARLEKVLADLLEASVKVCSQDELSGFDGSVGLDATPVPLWSRGPSARRGTSASDPTGAGTYGRATTARGAARTAKHCGNLLGARSHGRDDGPAPGGSA